MKKISVVILFLSIAFSVSAQDTIFFDDFNNNRNQWIETNTKTNLRKIKNGYYIFQNKLSKGALENRIAVSIPDTVDFEIGLTFRKKKGPNDRANGLIWGSNGKERFSFVISGNGKFAIDKLQDGKWIDFYPWTAIEYVKKDTALNTLVVKKAGDYYVFFINGKRIAQVKYQKLLGNQIGFYVSRQTTIEVDKIWVVKNKHQVYIPVAIFAETNDLSKKEAINKHDLSNQEKAKVLKEISVYTNYLKLHPESREARIFRADAYFALKEYVNAIADYNQILIYDVNNVEILAKRAEAYHNLKQYDKAILDMKKVTALDSNIFYKIKLAVLYIDNKNYKQAHAIVNEMLVKYQGNADLYNLRGEIFSLEKKYQEAIRDFQQALKLNPTHIKANSNLEQIKKKLNSENPEISVFSQLIEKNPLKASNYFYRGIEREKIFDYKGALSDYNQAIQLNFENDEVYLRRAQLYVSDNKKDLALADYEKYLEKHPWDLDIIKIKINLLDDLNRLPLALDDLNKAIRMQPDEVELYKKRSKIYIQQKDYDKALFDLQKIVSLDANDKNADFEYGKILIEQKKDKKEGCKRVQIAVGKGNIQAKEYFDKNCK